MDAKEKAESARWFLEKLSTMSSERLQQVIREAVGEELANLMFTYAREVLIANPEKALENASSMMLLGYLLRVHEDGAIPLADPAAADA